MQGEYLKHACVIEKAGIVTRCLYLRNFDTGRLQRWKANCRAAKRLPPKQMQICDLIATRQNRSLRLCLELM